MVGRSQVRLLSLLVSITGFSYKDIYIYIYIYMCIEVVI